MAGPPLQRGSFEEWEPRLLAMADAVRARTRASLLAAPDASGGANGGRAARVERPVAQGAGDVAFALDLAAEGAIDDWLREQARRAPLSLLTEDRGWRHAGPGPTGEEAPREAAGFDHGGPRIVVDPVDGTRNLMADLRPGWTVIGFAPPGPAAPRLGDLTGGIVAELPTARAAGFRVFAADAGGCRMQERDVASGASGASRGWRAVRVDDDDRADHGYFPFFRYEPRLRPELARMEARFFERLERAEGAELRSVYDDQYISNAGQLVLLLLGTYRMIVDARALVARRRGERTVTSKPYDLAGAVVCARAAGAVITAADGSPLDFPIDAQTPVDFAGYANEATRARLERHWLAVVAGAHNPG